MKIPKISVIMSVNNGMPYLKGAVNSILKQTFKDFEFIIVDDDSTDTTWKYLSNLKDRRIKLIKNAKNLGLALSLNKALQNVKGQFIARMDADDISEPNRFEIQLQFMKNNPNVDLCGSWAKLINKDGNIVGSKPYPTSSATIKRILPLYNPIIHPTFFTKRSFFVNNHGYDKKYDYAEDYELLMRTRKNYKFANIDRYLMKLRIGGEHRSTVSMQAIDIKEIKVKLKYYKNDLYNLIAAFGIFKKLITTFLIPLRIKIFFARKYKFA